MSFTKSTMLWFSIGVLACQNKETDEEDTGSSQTQSCVELTTEECATNSDCSVISATSVNIDEEINCYEQMETSEVGCQDANLDCANQMTFASSGDGNCLLFQNACIPEGWNSCQSMVSIQDCNDVKACSDLDPTICDGRDDCVVISASALTIDSAAECYDAGEVEPVGCMNAGTGCTGGITFAGPNDALEECMMFYNGCITEGWAVCDSLSEYATCDGS